ncbi:MAGE family protein [Ceratocystis platani]|uniref:MAGE family protein n=1 Tax=Ceratocystis fimbriata f. sp. platani TaxID=88771 RepID=A0A0F8BNY7_CERFI|nr:MAGE family protein [Ceratocystis platani]
MSRRRRTQNLEADDNETADITMADGSAPTAPDELHTQISRNLVRYALACDLQRMPIRRQAFREKYTFGMELRQLPAREKLTMEEKRKASASASTTAAKASDSYILISILPTPLRIPSLVTPSLAPTSDSEATYAGFYTLVVTLILLHGGEMTDPKLRRYLARMNADTHLGMHRTNDVLSRMERHGYLTKKIDKDAFTGADDERNTSYLVGPRAKIELAPENVAQFVRAVYGEVTPEIEKQISASLGTELGGPRGEAEGASGQSGSEAEEMDVDVDEQMPR